MQERAKIGVLVNRELSIVPGGVKILVDGMDMYVFPNFLSQPECAALMALIDESAKPSTILERERDAEFRTSYTCHFNRENPLVAAIDIRLSWLTRINPDFGEAMQGQRYLAGQQFKPHHDFFNVEQDYWPALERNGGQRTWTAMMFLNEPEAGGETFFPHVGAKITPIPGNAVVWNNLDVDGEPNAITLHQGLPVERGRKYIITKWFREREWTSARRAKPNEGAILQPAE